MRAEAQVEVVAEVVEVAVFTEEAGAEGRVAAAPVEVVQEGEVAATARIAGLRFETGREAESPLLLP
jgi:hypothetical protein